MIVNLPPESAWARVQLGGLTDVERVAVAQLQLTHAQFTVTAVAAGVKPGRVPPLTAFLPDTPVDEPDEPRTFSWWAQKLLPLAGGRV